MVIGAFSFQALGALLGAITGIVTIYLLGIFYHDAQGVAIAFAWRWILGFGLILALIVAGIRFSFFLESPRYHISQGDYLAASEAATILLDEPITITAETDPPSQEPRLPYWALFSPPYLRDTLLVSLPWFLQDIATYGIGIFTPTIISFLAFTGQNNLIEEQLATLKSLALVDLFLILGFLLAIVLVERWGRIKLQIVGFVGMAGGLLILGLSHQGGQGNMLLIFLGFLVFNLTMNAGPNSTTFLLSGEVFPTSIRASGAGFAAAFAKAGAVLGTFYLPILQNILGIPVLLGALSLLCLLAALITYLLRVETKGFLEENGFLSP
jgi:MFS family permease